MYVHLLLLRSNNWNDPFQIKTEIFEGPLDFSQALVDHYQSRWDLVFGLAQDLSDERNQDFALKFGIHSRNRFGLKKDQIMNNLVQLHFHYP